MSRTKIDAYNEALAILQAMIARQAVRDVDAVETDMKALMDAIRRAEKVSPATPGVALDLLKMMIESDAVPDYSDAPGHMDRIVARLGGVAAATGKANAPQAQVPQAAAKPAAAPKPIAAKPITAKTAATAHGSEHAVAGQSAANPGRQLAGAALKSFQRRQEQEAREATQEATPARNAPKHEEPTHATKPERKLAGAALKSFQRRQEQEAREAARQPALSVAAAAKPERKLAGAALKSFQRRQEQEAREAATSSTKASAAPAPEHDALPGPVAGTDAPAVPRLTAAQEGRLPACPLRESVQKDFIVCLHDGRQMKMLKRHIWNQYGMEPDDYRAYWGLPPDYPMVAPNYAKQKSRYAKTMGLGTAAMREEVAAKRETVSAS